MNFINLITLLTTMDNCVFCRIGKHEQEANFIMENDELYVVPDILPKAPVHFLVIPKEHIPSAHNVEEKHRNLLANMMFTANRIADEKGIGDTGYKLMFNVGKEGGQVIPHLHLHVLGGKQMGE